MRLLLFWLCVLFSAGAHAGICTPGNIELTTQLEVDSFQDVYGPDCFDVWANLAVTGVDISNLDGLAGISRVRGFLNISNNPILTDIGGLSSLVTTELFDIVQNPQLENLDGLDSLDSIGDKFQPSNGLTIAFNDSLVNLDALQNLNWVVGSLRIDSNPVLENLDGLGMLFDVDEKLSITNNAALTSLGGLINLSRIGHDLEIFGNPLLTSLDGLDNLWTLEGELYISTQPQLTDLDELSQLDGEVFGIFILANEMLQDISGLSGIDVTHSVSIRNNPMLQNLIGVGQFDALLHRGLDITNNDQLTNLDEFSNLTTLGAIFSPLMCGGHCASLTLEDNDNLQNVDGLSNLEWALGRVEIEDNMSLPDCNGLEMLLNGADDGETGPGPGEAGIPDVGRHVIMSGNAPGCNSPNLFIDILELDGFE